MKFLWEKCKAYKEWISSNYYRIGTMGLILFLMLLAIWYK